MPSLSTIICQILGTTGGHGTMLMYGLLWIPFLCCSPLPSPSGTPTPPSGATSFTWEALNRHIPCTEWVKPNCRNLVQCESIWLWATPAPFLLCSFPLHSRQVPGHKPRRPVRRGAHPQSLEGFVWISGFSCLKHHVTDLSSPWPQKKNLLPLNILSTVQIPSAFGRGGCLNKVNLQRQLSA